VPSSITCTAVLDVRRETAGHLAMLLRGHRARLGTRRGTRVPGVFKQAVLVLRWSVDGARLVQLARDNGISLPTTYRCRHETPDQRDQSGRCRIEVGPAVGCGRLRLVRRGGGPSPRPATSTAA